MASNQGNQGGGNQGGSRDRGSGSDDRGFAGMDDEQQREIARKGGEESARVQQRDEQGQFEGTRDSGGSGSRSGGSGSGSSGQGSGGQGGSGNQGGSNR
jgi:uncharacterized protein